MATAISFKRVLWGDFVKSKHLNVYLVTLSMPILITSVAVLVSLHRLSSETSSIWSVLRDNLFWISCIFYVTYTIIATWFISYTEHQAQSFQYLFVIPVSKGFFYFSKVLFLLVCLVSSFIFLYLFSWSAGRILKELYPQTKLSWGYLQYALFLLKLLIGSMPILSAQFFLSFYFNRYIIPLGVGCFMTVFGFILSIPENGYQYPYAYAFYLLREIDGIFLTPGVLWSLTYSAIFLVIGYLVWQKQ